MQKSKYIDGGGDDLRTNLMKNIIPLEVTNNELNRMQKILLY